MQLPQALQFQIDEKLHGVATSKLIEKSMRLSERYREEKHDGSWHIADYETALAYIATRLPATYAAIHSAMSEVCALRPDFTPKTLLDIGSGPGTALWAASTNWSSLEHAQLLKGADLSKRLVRISRSNFPFLSIGKLRIF